MAKQTNSALLVDIGPSECRLTLMGEYGGERPTFSQNASFASGDFASLEEMLRHYIKLACAKGRPPVLGLSVAQPVTRDVIQLPAPNWTIDKQELKNEFKFKEVVFVNDTSSMASSLLWLGPHDVKPIGAANSKFGVSKSGGRYGVVNVGFGLGIASLVGDDDNYTVVDSEGGHSAYAPQSAEELEILNELLKREPRISNEMILTLDGISRVHTAVCATKGEYDAKLSALEILLYGKTGAEENCKKTISMYFDMLASITGDMALNLCAVDGLFLSGDVVLKCAEFLPHDRFREVFQKKGAFTEFVSRIPTYIIANPSARLIGLARVICQRMEAERRRQERLAKPEALLSEITSAIDQAIMIVGEDLKIIACSRQSWYNLPGASEFTKPGQPIEQYFRALANAGQFGLSDSEKTADEIIENLHRGENFEFTRTTFGGRSITARVQKRAEGGFIIVETDNTELNTRTKELEELTASLREAKIKSDEASRAKSEFLANMSHEIRTPLNGVLGMADVLRKTSLETSQIDMLDVIIKSGNSLLTVINDILDFSKIEAGKLRLLQKPFDLRSTIEDVATMFATQVEKNNVELMVRVAPELPHWLVGDAGRLRQVLTNIAGNAVKFTKDGHILIDVAGSETENRAQLAISVKDTGCGIPQEKIANIFEMFEQVDGSSTRSHEGTGLGLTITKRILEAMNGDITAESVIGEGSTFTINVALPVYNAEKDESVSGDYGFVDISGARILIVDDQDVNRQILFEQTQSWGMEPLLAATGAEAIQTLVNEKEEGRSVDLAILDYQMPGMDGLALAKKIKHDPTYSNLPLILLTSVGHVGDAEEFVYDDFAGYLVKPARSAQLLDHIRKALGAASQPVEAVKETKKSAESVARLQAADLAPTTPALEPDIPPEPAIEAAASAKPASKKRSAAEQPVAGKKIKVFVVEDNPVNRMVFSSMLNNPGYELVELGDGASAVSEFERGRPDLILMDVSMPILDGYEATRQIREAEQANGVENGVPIVGVTAHALAEDRTKCIECGMNDYLAKPVKQDDLEDVIKRFCA